MKKCDIVIGRKEKRRMMNKDIDATATGALARAAAQALGYERWCNVLQLVEYPDGAIIARLAAGGLDSWTVVRPPICAIEDEDRAKS